MEELSEKITTGRQRVKKRNRTVEKTTSMNVSNKYKGTFVNVDVYKKDRRSCVFIFQMYTVYDWTGLIDYESYEL